MANKKIKAPKRAINLKENSKTTDGKQPNKYVRFMQDVATRRFSEYEAAKRNGFSESQARNTKNRIWGSKKARDIMTQVMIDAVNPKQLAENIRLGLSATKVQFIGRDGRPEMLADLEQRRRWHEYLARMQGLMTNDSTSVNGDNNTVIIFEDSKE